MTIDLVMRNGMTMKNENKPLRFDFLLFSECTLPTLNKPLFHLKICLAKYGSNHRSHC